MLMILILLNKHQMKQKKINRLINNMKLNQKKNLKIWDKFKKILKNFKKLFHQINKFIIIVIIKLIKTHMIVKIKS